MWCNDLSHERKVYKEFDEALRREVVYFKGNMVHLSKTSQHLELNIGQGGMSEESCGKGQEVECPSHPLLLVNNNSSRERHIMDARQETE